MNKIKYNDRLLRVYNHYSVNKKYILFSLINLYC